MAAAQPVRNKAAVRELANYYLDKQQLRNYLLIVAGVHTALRIGDLLKLRWRDIYNFDTRNCKEQIDIRESKTAKHKSVALNPVLQSAIDMYYESQQAAGEDFVFQNNRKGNVAISRIQAYRIIRAASESIGFQESLSCHSLRKTFGYHAWKTGVPVAVIMDIYNHSSYNITRRYLGISQDDRNQVYLNMHFL